MSGVNAGLLVGKNAVITGARGGIGKAIIRTFAKNGANIWACSRTEDAEFESELQELALECGVVIEPVYFDLVDDTATSSAIKGIIKQKRSIDVLVNNAGCVGGNLLFQMTPLAQMRSVFEVNFFSMMHVTQLVSRVMCRQKSGTIVNISSIAGIDGDPAQLEYSASKSAVICATKKLARELGQSGIRVNSVAPGPTETAMLDNMESSLRQSSIEGTALKRLAKPEEIANTVLFLASDLSSYITGQVIRADGGM